jgi:AraC-like DNA-binding protein
MDDRQMAVVQHYLGLLRMLIEANRYQAVLHLVRSFIYCLAEEYALLHPQQTASLTRAEQISGQYLSLIERFCREQHRVEWYASQLHLAPKYLSNVIRQTLGISPNVYINRALLRQAKSLLSSTLLSVQEIADRLGFHNQSHFGTFFKRMTGVSPSAFRYSVR